MPERFTRRILEHVSNQRYQPVQVRQLARELGIAAAEHDLFRRAVEQLVADGQVVIGSSDLVSLPPPGSVMSGVIRVHERGFAFLVPDSPTEHGDLFVPEGCTLGAMTGDRVRAKVIHQKGRGRAGRSPYTGRVVEIIQRADKHYVGTLTKRGGVWLVAVDGKFLHDPVVIRDPGAKNAREGDKVVVELIEYPTDNELAEGVITEVLGEAGEPDVETTAVIRAYGLCEAFIDEVLDDARAAARGFDDQTIPADREDLTGRFIVTIDPPDARDFDDAINIDRFDEAEPDGAAWELGVHIADVSHFVRVGGALDREAYQRGNSAYLPRKVVPMLPELLSNGVCSLQEGVNRLTKSAFIRFDEDGHVVGQRFARGVIRSVKRLTYLEAQALIDGDLKAARRNAATEPKYPSPLIDALKKMDALAKLIRKRRLDAGMIVLALPEVELVFDDSGRVIDAEPEDDAFTHTIIEMFMVEANEAAARLFDSLGVPMIRRIHADPPVHDVDELRQFARVAGYNIPARPTRFELQALLNAVRGKPAQHAVHLAVLRTLSQAVYAPLLIGHFALASEHYTHFTSPIRRYPDLVVHRGLDAYIEAKANAAKQKGGRKGGRKSPGLGRAMQDDDRCPDIERLHEIGRHCSSTERNAEAAERDLRNYLVLELMAENLGEDFDGTVTGVTGNGVYVQIDRYLIDGFIPVGDLSASVGGGGRWRLNRVTGALVAQPGGQSISIGDRFVVRIASVDPARRKLELVIISARRGKHKNRPEPKPKQKTKRRQPAGARKAHQGAMQIKRQKRTDKRKRRRR